MSTNDPNLYVPGMWQCPQCGFVQQNSILAPNGVFANAAPELRPCPNDGRDMNPVTWKHYAEQADAWGGKLLKQKEDLLAASETLMHIIHQQTPAVDSLFDAGIASAKAAILKAKGGVQ